MILSREDTPAGAMVIADLVAFGRDSLGNGHTYGLVRHTIASPTDGAESGIWDFQTSQAGMLASRFGLGLGIYAAGVTGGDKGAGTVNATGFYDDGEKLPAPAVIARLDANNTFTGGQVYQSGAGGTYLRTKYLPATPAAGPLGGVVGHGKDSLGNDLMFAYLDFVADDITDGSEDGTVRFVTTQAASLGVRMNVSNGLHMAGATGGDKGAGSINAAGLYVHGAHLAYEVGTFTPSIAGTSAAGVPTYGTRAGKYARVGDHVFFELVVNWSTHDGTGVLEVQSLPFASAAGLHTSVHSVISDIAMIAGYYHGGLILNGTPNIRLYQQPTGGGALTTIGVDGSGTVYAAGTYKIA